MGLPPSDFFARAHAAPLDLAVMAVGAVWYGWSRHRVRALGRSWPAGRTASFVAAWLVMAAAAFSGLNAFARSNFSAFGTEYILAGIVAPALLAFSAPVSLAVQASSRPDRGRRLSGRGARWVAGPFATWTGFSASLLIIFFSGLRGEAIAGGWADQAILLWVLAVGWAFYWPVVDVDPLPRRLGHWPRILYLLLSFPVFTILGMSLESQSTRVAPAVSVASLHLGAAVLWVAGEGIGVIGAIWVFVEWLRADERRARSHDLGHEEAAARQLALWRASREAAARAASR